MYIKKIDNNKVIKDRLDKYIINPKKWSFVACQIQGILNSQTEIINHIFHTPKVLIAYGDVCWDLNQLKMWTNWWWSWETNYMII